MGDLLRGIGGRSGDGIGGQQHGDRGAFVEHALDSQGAAVGVDDALRDGQAETRAGDRVVGRVAGAEEALEQARLVVLADAGAGVRYRQRHAGLIGRCGRVPKRSEPWSYRFQLGPVTPERHYDR
jgi:hypothetical protein